MNTIEGLDAVNIRVKFLFSDSSLNDLERQFDDFIVNRLRVFPNGYIFKVHNVTYNQAGPIRLMVVYSLYAKEKDG